MKETRNMTVCCKKLWKLLIDKDLKKKDLKQMVGISHYVIHKLNNGNNVTVDVIGKNCVALDCSADEILEFNK